MPKGPFRAAAFRNPHTGTVYETGLFHDPSSVPWEEGFEEGFVTHLGQFMDRCGASEYVNFRNKNGDSLHSEDSESGLGKSEDLFKMSHPTPTFPKLGLGDSRRETPYVSTPRELRSKIMSTTMSSLQPASKEDKEWHTPSFKGAANKKFNDMLEGKIGVRGSASAPGSGVQSSFAASGPMVHPKLSSDKATIGTKLHEDLHLHFNRVHNKYGKEGRLNLANNLLESIPKQYREAVEQAQHHFTGNLYAGKMLQSEEKLARIINYMNSGFDRKILWAKMRRDVPSFFAPEFDSKMRRAYHALRAASEVADETWVTHVKTHMFSKSDSDDMHQEDLSKMSIAGIEPGRKLQTGQVKHHSVYYEDSDIPVFDYNHILTPEHKSGGYSIHLYDEDGNISAHLKHNGNRVGTLYATHEPNSKTIQMAVADIAPEHQNKRLGTKLYEAVLAHGWHNLGAKYAAGEPHSTLASKTHQSLSRIHGMDYSAARNPEALPSSSGAYDSAFGSYKYAIKSEDDTSFDFGANVAPEDKYARGRKVISRMRHPEKRQQAEQFLSYVEGKLEHRPGIEPSLERHLARFGIADPKGYPFTETGRDMRKPLPGPRVFEEEPDALKRRRFNEMFPDAPYMRSEFLAFEPHPLDEELRKKAERVETDLKKGTMSRRAPFAPGDIEGRFDIRDWQMGWGGPEARENLPEMEPNAKTRALHKLHAVTDVRRSPTGEREFLLHRGVGGFELPNLTDTHIHSSGHTSWTPVKGIAEGYVRGNNKLVSAWVPESAIKLIPKQLGGMDLFSRATYKVLPGARNEMAPEHEVVVRPGTMLLAKGEHEMDPPEASSDVGLTKAQDPKDFHTILKASDQKGRELVDHTPDLLSHPDSIQPGVDLYRKEIKNHPDIKKRTSAARGSGITAKVIYKAPLPDAPKTHQKYMVKPYNEGIIKRIQGWQQFPLQGWAEMTNQALYHAGGIGDLHQKVHVEEHKMEEKPSRNRHGGVKESEPALVVHMAEGYNPVHGHTHDNPNKDALRKIAVMDFLSNNLDRHRGNLMLNKDGTPLAVDHSRSFQYSNTHYRRAKGFGRKEINAMAKRTGEGTDSFQPYVDMMHSAVGKFIPFPSGWISPSADPYKAHQEVYDRKEKYMRDFAPIIEEWWPKHRDAIVQTMESRLKQIKDPEVSAHIGRNFMARVGHLDERAKMGLENYGVDWYKDNVDWYPFGENTDEERENLRRRLALEHGVYQ